MVFLIIHNEYQHRGGEESVVDFQKNLLEQHGHKVILYTRNYHELGDSSWGRVKSIFTSIYNPQSVKDIKKIVKEEKPDIAIIHNVFSIISPAIIPVLKKMNVKVWQIVHNYRMFCPIGIFFHNGKICEQCLKAGREFHCAKNNCTNSRIQSLAFAFKFFIVRKLNYYKGVDRFYTLSYFQKNKFIENGFKEEKIYYLPNTFVPQDSIIETEDSKKQYIGFVGRLTKEKGFYDFVELAKLLPDYKFVVAGEVTQEVKRLTIPNNLAFEGFLDKKGMERFYNKCRVIMFLSTWYEGFPMVLAESLYYKTPLVVNNLSVMAEVVEDNKTGFVLKQKNYETIKENIIKIFNNKVLYSSMRENCQQEFYSKYSVDNYYNNLIKCC